MKKSILVVLSLIICLNIANAAHYYNKEESESKEITINHYVLKHVKADRAMITTSSSIWDAVTQEEEDWWTIKFEFTEDVEKVEIRWTALDGVNDHDTRVYTDKYDTITKDKEYTKRHTNFPTYVDNMKIDVRYLHKTEVYSFTYYIYTEGDPNNGNGNLSVNLTGIPEEYITKDGDGAFGDDKLTQILQFVAIPYKFSMWLVDIDNVIALLASMSIIGGSIIFFGYLPSSPLKFAVIIPIYVGVTMFVGSIGSLIGSVTS